MLVVVARVGKETSTGVETGNLQRERTADLCGPCMREGWRRKNTWIERNVFSVVTTGLHHEIATSKDVPALPLLFEPKKKKKKKKKEATAQPGHSPPSLPDPKTLQRLGKHHRLHLNLPAFLVLCPQQLPTHDLRIRLAKRAVMVRAGRKQRVDSPQPPATKRQQRRGPIRLKLETQRTVVDPELDVELFEGGQVLRGPPARLHPSAVLGVLPLLVLGVVGLAVRLVLQLQVADRGFVVRV